ncbi:MAG: ABC transporter ATP-binding protein [Spirochaetota bacterium]|nr:MAG: ABC transporter ATP-binding protein [Spirochaetota bacterium]
MERILNTENLTKHFGGLLAISNLSFDVMQGSITAIIGPNGAGKTTLFNLISGLLKPDSGKILYKEKRLDTKKHWEIPHMGIARTFQNLRVFANMTITENIMMGRYTHSSSGIFSCALNLKRYRNEERDIRERAHYWMEFMNIDSLKGKKLKEIPFEKQRLVEITRAVASEPELILLDEPAAGLNVTETKTLTDSIYKIRELGTTILIVEHDIDLVMEISERIIVLNFGEKIAEGPPKIVRNDEKVIAVYLGSEFAE